MCRVHEGMARKLIISTTQDFTMIGHGLHLLSITRILGYGVGTGMNFWRTYALMIPTMRKSWNMHVTRACGALLSGQNMPQKSASYHI